MKAELTSVTLVVLFLLAVFAYAQDDKSSTDNVVARMKAELNLTQAQADVVKPIIEECTTKRQQLRQSLKEQGITDTGIILSQMEKLREEEDQKLIQVLTTDQVKQWSKKQKISDFLNKDRMSDTEWAPQHKDNNIGLGTSF